MKDNLKIPVNPSYHEVKSDYAKKWEENKSKEYKEYRKKWVKNPKNFILEKGPIHLDIEPTNACNLKCSMCPRTIMNDSPNSNFEVGYMDMNLYKSLIDQAAELGVYSIKLNWLGEPLLHEGIVKMIKYAKEKGIIDVMFNTNGTLLNEDITIKLINAGLDKIFFSFDSPYKEKYEDIRVGANYQEVLNNITRVKKIREKLGKNNPLTRVSMVLMKNNQDDYDDFVELFKDKVDIIGYSYYMNHQEMIGEEEKVTTNKKIANFACSQLWQRMFITWDGEILVCCADDKREYVVGNANEDKLVNVWENKKYKYIRKKHKEGNYMDIDICSKCDLPTLQDDGDV